MFFGSGLRSIARLSADRPDRETGGGLFGHWRRDGVPVVQLVTGPGPAAVHEPTHFADEPSHIRHLSQSFRDEFGIEMIGRWHSHQFLGLAEPSAGDRTSAGSFMRRNRCGQFLEVITNHQPRVERPRRNTLRQSRSTEHLAGYGGSGCQAPTVFTVAIKAFLYDGDPHRGEVTLPIRVLPGVSPVRRAALARGFGAWVCGPEVMPDWPEDRLRFERAGTDTLPDSLQRQIASLPEAVKTTLHVESQPDTWLVSWSRGEGHRMRITIAYAEFDGVTRVETQSHPGHPWIDLTDRLPQAVIPWTLRDVYEAANVGLDGDATQQTTAPMPQSSAAGAVSRPDPAAPGLLLPTEIDPMETARRVGLVYPGHPVYEAYVMKQARRFPVHHSGRGLIAVA
ncbi:MAG: hypothetical protein AAGH88_09035 [Planctomycetota bacterium]